MICGRRSVVLFPDKSVQAAGIILVMLHTMGYGMAFGKMVTTVLPGRRNIPVTVHWKGLLYHPVPMPCLKQSVEDWLGKSSRGFFSIFLNHGCRMRVIHKKETGSLKSIIFGQMRLCEGKIDIMRSGFPFKKAICADSGGYAKPKKTDVIPPAVRGYYRLIRRKLRAR